MRDRQKSSDLLKAFRESRQQIQKPVDNSVENVDNSKENSKQPLAEVLIKEEMFLLTHTLSSWRSTIT